VSAEAGQIACRSPLGLGQGLHEDRAVFGSARHVAGPKALLDLLGEDLAAGEEGGLVGGGAGVEPRTEAADLLVGAGARGTGVFGDLGGQDLGFPERGGRGRTGIGPRPGAAAVAAPQQNQDDGEMTPHPRILANPQRVFSLQQKESTHLCRSTEGANASSRHREIRENGRRLELEAERSRL
jgi:hypothetical protein